MKKLMLCAISFLVFTQVNIYALEDKDALNPFAADDKIAKDDKDSDRTMKVSENKPKKKAVFAMGIEGGYMWELLDANVAPDSLEEIGLSYAMPNYAKVGITFSGSQMYENETGIAKHSSTTALGYIFIENGWGAYFSIDYNRNFKLDKKGSSYFYLGAGTGVSYTSSSGSFNVSTGGDSVSFGIDNTEFIWQALRVPIGFKFLLSKSTELFFESAFYLGMIAANDAIYSDSINGGMPARAEGSLGVETKGGLRFIF